MGPNEVPSTLAEAFGAPATGFAVRVSRGRFLRTRLAAHGALTTAVGAPTVLSHCHWGAGGADEYCCTFAEIMTSSQQSPVTLISYSRSSFRPANCDLFGLHPGDSRCRGRSRTSGAPGPTRSRSVRLVPEGRRQRVVVTPGGRGRTRSTLSAGDLRAEAAAGSGPAAGQTAAGGRGGQATVRAAATGARAVAPLSRSRRGPLDRPQSRSESVTSTPPTRSALTLYTNAPTDSATANSRLFTAPMTAATPNTRPALISC